MRTRTIFGILLVLVAFVAFGPALIAGGPALSQLWLFLAAPVVGAVLAALAYRGLSLRPELRPRPGHHQHSTATPASSAAH